MKKVLMSIAAAFVAIGCSMPDMQAKEVKADNTKKNSKAYSEGMPTAQNQSNDKASVDRTADLRKAIMDTKGLSTNAQNIKIIDESGKMTLRGPVDSQKEKSTINKLAKTCYGRDFVNALEVVAPAK